MTCGYLKEMEIDVIVNKKEIGSCKILIYGNTDAVNHVCKVLEEREDK